MLDLISSIPDIIDQYGFSYSCPSTTSWPGLELCQSTIVGEMDNCLCFSMSLDYYQSIPRQELCQDIDQEDMDTRRLYANLVLLHWKRN